MVRSRRIRSTSWPLPRSPVSSSSPFASTTWEPGSSVETAWRSAPLNSGWSSATMMRVAPSTFPAPFGSCGGILRRLRTVRQVERASDPIRRRAQHCSEARRIGALRELLVEIAERHAQIVADRRILACAQFPVDRHETEIGLGERLGDVLRVLRRVDADQGEAALEFGASFAPGGLAERRHGVAVEDR